MKPLSPVEKELLAWVKHQDVNPAKPGRALSKHDDNTLEKSYTDLMRGVGNVHLSDPFPRQPCTCSMTDDGEHSSDCLGRWLHTLNHQGTCYLYVHTITHEIRGSRPPGFVHIVDTERQQKIMAARGGPWHAFPTCHLLQWKEAVAALAAKEGKTPLLLADNPEMYKALIAKIAQPDGGGVLVDTRPLVLPVAKTGIKFEDHFAKMMTLITSGLKAGKPVILDLQDNSPNWLDKVCKVPKYGSKFPEQVFDPNAHGWQKALSPSLVPGFTLVLLTTLTPKEYERELKDKLPWHLIAPLRVTTHIPAEHCHLADVTRALESAHAQHKVPLLLDETAEHSVDTFLAYQHTEQVDVPQLLASARTTEEIRELLRHKLVTCMKSGQVLLLRLKNSTPDFLHKYCSDDSFPLATFSAAEVVTDKWTRKLFKDHEKEHGVGVCRAGFQVVLTSWRPVETFGTDLVTCLPLHLMDVWAVEAEEHH